MKKRQPTERLFVAGDVINECVHTPIYICGCNAFIDLLNCPSVLLSARTLAYVSRHIRRAFTLVTSYLFYSVFSPFTLNFLHLLREAAQNIEQKLYERDLHLVRCDLLHGTDDATSSRG